MLEIFGLFIAIIFFGAALKMSFLILRIVFALIGVVIMVTVFPVIAMPFLAIFGVFSFIINIMAVPLIIIIVLFFIIRMFL